MTGSKSLPGYFCCNTWRMYWPSITVPLGGGEDGNFWDTFLDFDPRSKGHKGAFIHVTVNDLSNALFTLLLHKHLVIQQLINGNALVGIALGSGNGAEGGRLPMTALCKVSLHALAVSHEDGIVGVGRIGPG